MLGPHFHSWLDGLLGGLESHYQPKENMGDTILFSAIVIFLVLIAGLMSGTPHTALCSQVAHDDEDLQV
jgi:hypothetical protein